MKHARNVKPVSERIEAYRKFKQEVSAFSLRFADFEQAEQARLPEMKVFKKGLSWFTQHFVEIIKELDNEITDTNKAFEILDKQHENSVQSLMQVLDRKYFSKITEELNKSDFLNQLHEALKTVRKLPVFGYTG